MFIRFVVADDEAGWDQQRGLLTEFYRLDQEGELLSHEEERFREAQTWLNAHLPQPEALSPTRPDSPGRTVRWLRVSSAEHVSCMRALAALLESKGIPVQEIISADPGRIVYEDDHQVAAVPFPKEDRGPRTLRPQD